MYIVGGYTSDDLMSDLICDNYSMLLILNRFGISLGFGDDTIDEVCSKYKIDTCTFLAIVNLYLLEDNSSYTLDATNISLSSLLGYLHNSHSYFLDYKFKSIREKLVASLNDLNNPVAKAIIRYYDEYVNEIRIHMLYEENVVFPYSSTFISSNLNDKLDLKKNENESCNDNKFNIEVFSMSHENIDIKLDELKNIIIKYYSSEATNELSSVLFDIFTCEQDLASHNNIEDFILVPTIKTLEESKYNGNGK